MQNAGQTAKDIDCQRNPVRAGKIALAHEPKPGSQVLAALVLLIERATDGRAS
jgi:hypothetical protein